MIRQFLHHVLPAQGLYVLLVISKQGGRAYPKQYVYSTIDDMAAAALQFDMAPDADVYYAMASYKQGWHTDPATGKAELRTRANAALIKSFYADFDVKPNTDGHYNTKNDAYNALVQFNNAMGMPVPMVVESANGFHAYWVLDTPMQPEQWQHYATGLKNKMMSSGLMIDPAVTADVARVLRPIGTHNKKNGGHFLVSLVGGVPATSSPAMFNQFWVDDISVKVKTEAAAAQSASPYMGLVPLQSKSESVAHAIEMTSMPDAKEIVAGCKQLQVCGHQSEPHWFGAMSILAKVRGGRQMAHELSSLDPRYTPADTDEKFDRALTSDHPPMKCETFARYNASGCDGCPNRTNGTVTPLYPRGDAAAAETVAKAAEREIIPNYLQAVLASREMRGFKVVIAGTEHGVYRQSVTVDTKTKETTYEWEYMTDRVLVPIYKVNPIYNPAEPKQPHSRLFWREIKPTGEIRDIEVFTNILSNKQSFESWLFDNSIRVMPESQEGVRQYMRSIWTGALDFVPDLTELDRVGWTKEDDKRSADGSLRAGRYGFALGQQVFWPNSPPTQLQPTADLAADLDKYGFAGTLAEWKKPQEIINNVNQVWAQAILCMVLGSVMAEHMAARDGLPLIYVYSKGSGLAKSTAMRYAMSAFGDPQHMMVTGGSWSARINAMVRANSLPTLHDELTQTHLKEMEDLLMAQSQGVEKDRMANTGGASKFSRRQWRSLAFSNGNESFADAIAAQTTNEGPLLARLIEVDLNHLPGYTTNVDVKAIFDKSYSNYGIAGRMMIQYILDNMAECKALMLEYHKDVTREFGGSSLERMWHGAIALLKFGCIIGKKIGLHEFEWEPIHKEATRWISDMRRHLGKSEDKEASSFADLMRYVYRGLIITDYYGAPKPNEPQKKVRQVREDEAPMARIDLETRELTVPNSVMRKFGIHNRTDINKMASEWESAGRIKSRGDRRCITSYTNLSVDVPVERCFIFHLSDDDLPMENAATMEGVAEALNAVYGDIALTNQSAVINNAG